MPSKAFSKRYIKNRKRLINPGDTSSTYWVKVDAAVYSGMLTETVSIQMKVKILSNSSILSKENFSEIHKVTDFMKKFDQTKVVVGGYSDDRGAAAYNKTLSQKRVDAVRETLINHFTLDAKRVSAMGYGEDSPIADNNTVAGELKTDELSAW